MLVTVCSEKAYIWSKVKNLLESNHLKMVGLDFPCIPYVLLFSYFQGDKDSY